jgi:hypothetical protein
MKKVILVPSVTYVHVNKCKEPTFNGSPDGSDVVSETRWDRAKALAILNLIKKSIKKNNFLSAVIGVELPCDIEIDEILYRKGEYLVIDENGRVRVLKALVKEGYTLQSTDKDQKPNHLPLIDLTDIVIKDKKTIELDKLLEDLWDAIRTLNTNQTKHTTYDTISDGARLLNDTTEKEKWVYLANAMKKYYGTLTNDVIIRSTTKTSTLPESALESKKIDFDMTWKRYSDVVLENLAEIRKIKGAGVARAGFLGALGKYFMKSAHTNSFLGCRYEMAPDPSNIKFMIVQMKLKSDRKCFLLNNKGIGDDDHFIEFKNAVEFISQMFIADDDIPAGGYSGDIGRATREIHPKILSYNQSRITLASMRSL